MTTVYDDAGRPKYIKEQMGSTVTHYAGNPTNPIQYKSNGAKSSIVMGNGMTETRGYNSRLQMTKIQAGSLLAILNCYHESDDPQGECDSLLIAGNNGSVQRQKITRGALELVQNYTYDSVNRLSSTTEEGIWSQSYAYDAFGNRWLSSSSGVTVDALTPTNQSWYDAATNRLAGANTYDARGNMTTHGSHTLTYDGEDRLVAASGATPSAKYEYDGEGRRVLAHSCSGTTTCVPGPNANTTIFVYDAFGQLAMEYRAEAATAGTSYYTRDHLGSTRLEMNASGQQVKCSDFLPFGEEIAAGTGSRSACFNANDNKVKFTGKERDTETGLDYFMARYFSSAQGRFTSPDPLLASARLTDPQTWNRYAYVRNNPLNYVDPDGRYLVFTNSFCTDSEVLIAIFGEDWLRVLLASGAGRIVGPSIEVTVEATFDPLPVVDAENPPTIPIPPEPTPISEDGSGGAGSGGGSGGGGDGGGGVPQTKVQPKRQESYYTNALKHKGTPYKKGGKSNTGVDCSGLVKLATGLINSGWWTGQQGPPPGNWILHSPALRSYKSLAAGLLVGDLILFPGHVAFYAGNDVLYHAQHSGTSVDFTGGRYGGSGGSGCLDNFL